MNGEKYQLHCAYCFRRFEDSQLSIAIWKVESHERENHANILMENCIQIWYS